MITLRVGRGIYLIHVRTSEFILQIFTFSTKEVGNQEIFYVLAADVIVASLSEEDCCGLADLPAGSAAGCRSLCPAGTKPKRLIAAKAGRVIGAAARGVSPASYECAMASASNATAAAFAGSVRSKIGSGSNYVYDGAGYAFYPLQNSTPLINQQ